MEDRIGLEEKFLELLGVRVPFHTLCLKAGRDAVLLLETLALNNRLKERGEYTARKFHEKLQEMIQRKNREQGFRENCTNFNDQK